MKRMSYLTLFALFAAAAATAQDDIGPNDPAAPAEDAAVKDVEETASDTLVAAAPDQPRAMSGMSILGNEEAPKALVIIPWKSSELGDELGMPEHADDRATPVDREVFLRELRFYEIRQGKDEPEQ